MAQSSEKLSVADALAAYASMGPEPDIGEMPPGSERWLTAADGHELTGNESLRFAWIAIEHGFHELHTADRLRYQAQGGRKKGGGRAPQRKVGGARVPVGQSLMTHAQNLLTSVIDSEDEPSYVTAQASLTFGALPFIRAMRAPGDSRKTVYQQRNVLTTGQVDAVMDLSDVIQRGGATPDVRAFARLLGVSTIANNLVGNTMLALPAPPRCYEGLPHGVGWHTMLYDISRNRESRAALASSTTASHTGALLSRETPESEIDEQAIQIILDLNQALKDERHLILPDSELGKAIVAWAGLIGQMGKRRQVPKIDLPDLMTFSEDVGLPVKLETDLRPIEYPEINFASLGVSDLLAWYGEQANPRALTYQEGLRLNKLLDGYDALQISRLSLEEQLILNHVRLECALALADRYGPAANRQLDISDRHLQRIQKEGQAAHDPAVVFEAAVDGLRLRLLGSAIRGEVAETSGEDLTNELSELIVEIDFENRRTSKPDYQSRLNTLMRELLQAVLAMRFASEAGLIAMPAFGREKGSGEIPGWSVNVWQVGADGAMDLASRRKLRMSDEAGHVMRQGDIGIVPNEVIRDTAPIKFIAENLISYTKEDERKRRAGKLIERWSGNLRPVFDEALAFAARHRT